MGRCLTQETEVQNEFDDVASTVHQSQAAGPSVLVLQRGRAVRVDSVKTRVESANGFSP